MNAPFSEAWATNKRLLVRQSGHSRLPSPHSQVPRATVQPSWSPALAGNRSSCSPALGSRSSCSPAFSGDPPSGSPALAVRGPPLTTSSITLRRVRPGQAVPALHSHPLQSGLCSHRHNNAANSTGSSLTGENVCAILPPMISDRLYPRLHSLPLSARAFYAKRNHFSQ